MLRKLVLAVAAVAALGATTLSTSTPASAWGGHGWHGGGGWHGGFRGYGEPCQQIDSVLPRQPGVHSTSMPDNYDVANRRHVVPVPNRIESHDVIPSQGCALLSAEMSTTPP